MNRFHGTRLSVAKTHLKSILYGNARLQVRRDEVLLAFVFLGIS